MDHKDEFLGAKSHGDSLSLHMLLSENYLSTRLQIYRKAVKLVQRVPTRPAPTFLSG